MSALALLVTADYPAAYLAAKQALAKCDAIDEVKDLANRAEALAVYARQSKDDSLVIMAQRIQARAIRRCGELLRAIPARPGFNPEVRPLTRTAVAKAAGLTVHDRLTAVRVAAIPTETFEQKVESNNPPSVSQLSFAGRKRGRPRKDAVRACCPTCGRAL